ncbi:MAG: hypothetical protein MUF57_09865 [Gammaproteobacteria bacterium]|nr:hypothetical protein [Gammaproteobacteria bacterium]
MPATQATGIFAVPRQVQRIERIATPGDSLHLRLLGHLRRVLDLDAEVSDRAFEFAMAEQQLDGPQTIAGKSCVLPRAGQPESSGTLQGRCKEGSSSHHAA